MKPDSPKTSKPLPDDIHDVVLVPEAGGVERFPVDRKTGRYDEPPENFTRDKPGGRKARAVLDPDPGIFGPAFAVAPTRPEPAAQNGTCVLINQHNVQIRNPWTTARLNNEPPAGNELPDPYNAPLPPADKEDRFEILIAGPCGKVYLVHKEPGSAPSIAELENLGLEGEIWYQLRSGFIAGSIRCFQRDNRVIPMVNVTSLMRE
ncbi:MAG TPA: hypothetical protein VHO06_16895 [Polyangia bacterium]|nr:hypothetical protein [Polyangia bacterium]